MERNAGGFLQGMGRRAGWLAALVTVVVALAPGCGGEPADGSAGDGDVAATGSRAEPAEGEATGDDSPVLDGTERSFVVVGYSTSYAWPAMLQEMLDEHAGGERAYHVLNAVIGGSPVGRWIAPPDSEEYAATYGAMLRDFFGPDARLRGDAPEPTVAIVQQSLQRTPTPETRLGPVGAADDEEGIGIGADALEELAMQLRDDGVEHVYIATHIYKEGYEPEVGNERFALDALLRRGRAFIHEGPEVWSPTLRNHPDAFAEDGLHPNQRGMKIMAEGWYRALAGDDARQEIVDAMRARDYDVASITDEYLAWREVDGGE